jgi:hypothetical protein
MNITERQQREIEALNREINECYDNPKKLCHTDIIGLYNALEQVTNDPETYFKNIDREEE